MKMKNILAGACALILLAGCSDASAKLANGSETVMTVGNQTFSKNDIYQMLVSSAGGDTVYSKAQTFIAEQEVELTDEMKDSAKNTLELYSMMYGDQFTDYLKSSGLTEDDYVNTVILPSMQAEKLPEIYINEHFDELVSTYEPIQVIVLSFSSQDDASKAISALKDGSATAEEAAASNNSASKGEPEILVNSSMTYDSAVLTVLRSGSVDDGWVEVPSSDGATFYVVKIVSKNTADFKDEAVTALGGISTVTNAATDYFFRKYNFHVYDIDVYNQLKSNHPEILIQDSKANVSATASPEATAPAAE
ncbi:MAG: hypothetical protein IKE28_11370 [Solobacterium sp.]|nr:hypothetical protein [Solobacterium sp.]